MAFRSKFHRVTHRRAGFGASRANACAIHPRDVYTMSRRIAPGEIITSGDATAEPSTTSNQHMLITADTRFGQITNASVEREHDQNRGQASLASARRLRGEDHANDSHASGPRRGSSALQLPGTRGRGTGRPGRGRHRAHALGEARVRGAYAGIRGFRIRSSATARKWIGTIFAREIPGHRDSAERSGERPAKFPGLEISLVSSLENEITLEFLSKKNAQR